MKPIVDIDSMQLDPALQKFGIRITSLRRFLLISVLSTLFLTIGTIGVLNYLQLNYENQQVLKSELINAVKVIDTIIDIKDLNPQHKIAYDFINQNQSKDLQLPALGMNVYNGNLNYRDKMVFQIWNLNKNQLIMKSSNTPSESLSTKNKGFDVVTLADGSSWYSMSLINQNKNIRTVVAIQKKLTTSVMLPLLVYDSILLVIVFIGLALLLILLIQISLSPLERVTTEISERGPTHLTSIGTDEIPVEIAPLVNALNRLFLQMRESIAREKQFTTDAAHELRTPLAAVKTQVEVVLREKDELQRIRILNNILIGTNRITHIVDQLLTLSRLESSTKLTRSQALDLNKLTAQIVADLALSAISKQIEIELFAPDEEIIINGEPNLITILIRNLVDNAIRYTPTHGKIAVLLSKTSYSICLQVIDNGPGIPTHLHHRLFDRFFREVGTKVEGSGLGLPITKEIVRLHHASVFAKKPEQGSGLEMRVDFPKAD
ncbi:MAG: ATP-binding protein [Gammaproteobacteria bacterium]|nr:ATP-binding protein [Gammaproteobacteria bacterium]